MPATGFAGFDVLVALSGLVMFVGIAVFAPLSGTMAVALPLFVAFVAMAAAQNGV